MLYEDPTKELSSDERFHVELHFSPGVNCCVQKDLVPGPGFRPQSRRERNAEIPEIIEPEHQPTPPPPLVCTIKCSKDSFHKVFENPSEENLNSPAPPANPITIKVTNEDSDLACSKVD